MSSFHWHLFQPIVVSVSVRMLLAKHHRNPQLELYLNQWGDFMLSHNKDTRGLAGSRVAPFSLWFFCFIYLLCWHEPQGWVRHLRKFCLLNTGLAMSRGRVGGCFFFGLFLRSKEIFLRRPRKIPLMSHWSWQEHMPIPKPITAMELLWWAY